MVRRAALHSALGDPGRLAIVDALLPGDAAPSTLQTRLGMSSNLLAHHVGVLETAGVLRRVRSEGDRRRTYLTLVPGALAALAPTATLEPTAALAGPRVVFVCTENAARSQLAAACWPDHSTVPAASAGTRPAARIHPGARAVARRRGVALAAVAPRPLVDVLHTDDVVITVCDRAHEELADGLPHTHWSIPDPAHTDPSHADDAFDRALDELTDRIARIAPAVHPTPARSA